MHGIAFDALHDEIIVPVALAGAILVFRGAAKGEEPPIRVIQGPRTRLIRPQTVAVDTVNGEIMTGDPSTRSVLVFPREANGDVAPTRTIGGAKTGLYDVVGVGVDPVRNLIVATSRVSGGSTGLFVFNRTDNGDVTPRAVVSGPNTRLAHFRQLAIDTEHGNVFIAEQSQDMAAMSPYSLDQVRPNFKAERRERTKDRGERVGFIALWDINDNGDVPPRGIIKGPGSRLLGPGGVAINPKETEVYAVDGGSNGVFSYLVPDLFRDLKKRE